MVGTFWSLVPAIVAIALALITKEVYSSLFVGIIVGALFFAIDAGSGFAGFFNHIFSNTIDEDHAYGMIVQLSDSWNVGILVFLVVLGVMVALMNKAGGSAAFGRWAKKHIKTKVGAQIATIFLGIFIFIDDYFNCLTVGSVMRPVTDKYGISREKLAYLIDATAAPICIIAPISSWAAAVAGFAGDGENGIMLFVDAIPFNFYAIFTVFMMFAMVLMKFEYGKMAKFEEALTAVGANEEEDKTAEAPKGKVIDLVFPVVTLIVFCILGMIYTGGFFTKMVEEEGEMVANPNFLNIILSFSDSDASVGLVLGSFAALIITVAFYCIRRILSFKKCMNCIPDGFKAMVPAILILTLAWTLKSMTDSLGAKEYVAGLVEGSAAGLKLFLPAIIFIIACGLAFATGTSWGTFGILIPICIAAFPSTADPIRIISISACMAGAVCGDHCSPISDTTIMASAGAQCDHVNHVSTQLPYAISVAVISFITYIVAGVTSGLGTALSAIISLVFGVAVLFGFLFVMRMRKQTVKAK
ncbi:MAG: Na+/H+ antiporter NhaC family protein [Spirochaetaceae bacterium]|nr:Na+/H+ antiporter NhaC family protein [Spirochaetaceae bacterium]